MTSSNHNHPYGQPINVLKFDDEGKIAVDNAEIEKMFLHPEVKNRKVVVFSIIGAFRKGKSFFLDYCLRFLYANYPSIANPDNNADDTANWMKGPTDPLHGFSWRSGSVRDTTGIIMWSDVFLHTVPSTGEKIAIVIIDTQGLFDNKSSPMDNSRIFALGTLISSIQILNLNGVIQEDQLQYLQFATEFAKFAAKDNYGEAGKPFQSLMFLIRDWPNPDEYPFGTDGGADYLNSVLKIESDQKEELKSVRQFISSSFDDVKSCLLPYPGRHVASTKSYDGQWSLMDELFKDELFSIIGKLLGPDAMVLKQINGKDLTASELKVHIEGYFELFQSGDLPQAQSIYESTIKKQMSILITKCTDLYKENIYKNQAMLTEENLHVFHDMSKSMMLNTFITEKKMGNKEHAEKYQNQLVDQVEKLYVEWKDRSLESIQNMKAEQEKTRLAILEKIKHEKEAFEAEARTKEKQAELERLKNRMRDEENEHDRETYRLRLVAEQARTQQESQRAETYKAEKKTKEKEVELEEMKKDMWIAKFERQKKDNELRSVADQARTKEIQAQQAIKKANSEALAEKMRADELQAKITANLPGESTPSYYS